jgi:c-di-GMP-binding flagellar brake protein YcgR
MNRIPVRNSDVEIGKPLPWDIYAPQGERLASANDVVLTQESLQNFLFLKACRDSDGESGAGKPGDDHVAGAGNAQDGKFLFEAMKLKVGDRLQVQLPARFAVDRLIVRLIGYINNLSLLITPPREASGLRVQLEEDDELVVRIFSSQNAFGFSSTVAKIIKLPFEYLHISFPAEVKGMVIRKAPRVRSKIICSVITEKSGDESVTGVLVNLSAKGALLASRQVIAGKSDTIKLIFRVLLHGTEAFLNLTAVVRSQFAEETVASPSSFHHGLEFVDLQPKDSVVLQSLIYQKMIEQPSAVM